MRDIERFIVSGCAVDDDRAVRVDMHIGIRLWRHRCRVEAGSAHQIIHGSCRRLRPSPAPWNVVMAPERIMVCPRLERSKKRPTKSPSRLGLPAELSIGAISISLGLAVTRAAVAERSKIGVRRNTDKNEDIETAASSQTAGRCARSEPTADCPRPEPGQASSSLGRRE